MCARAHGADASALGAELTSKHAALCGEAGSCAVEQALTAWLALPLQLELPGAASAKK